MQVTRFAAPLAYNYLHVIRMNEYLGSDRVTKLPLLYWFGKTVQATCSMAPPYTQLTLGAFLYLAFLQSREEALLIICCKKCLVNVSLAERCWAIKERLLLSFVQATVFAQEMGTAMHDVPVFGADFNTWFPLVVVVYCTLL
jgi:hypothetical protein